ncbi:RNA polymerase sigma-70 factor [Pseudomonas sp. No.21]|uniref:RNA polymerase sigma factor SigJ n=1 Tax=Pseudomonas TaxID=286 RepID=UPI000DA77822|nr:MULTISPECIES: RNA polymerase sigma factor SigJ [Pseudomonas]MDW3712423.1 RNA polymerase sigma factor SigJ [Pseudomonas sp. 2023EL-01195]PZE11175.1 RNA polymerase subunit sigma-24 [Pseudomonas sp. 57B-090624]GJN45890.1 sigma factor [Pseudomonas tohonis]
MQTRAHLELFQQHRPRLLGLAYRILGSRADAEDALQDCWLKWQEADLAGLDNPAAWLTTLCTRRCIDLLRSARRTRVDYVGSWLPEPIHGLAEDGPDEGMVLAASLQTAFLLVLERLSPKERAAYLLHDIFERPYAEVAGILAVQESACRKLVSRARTNVEDARVRHVTPVERQEQLLAAFRDAIEGGNSSALAGLLGAEVELRADGGGKVPTLRETLHGREAVLGFIEQSLRLYWGEYRWQETEINGSRGVILRHGDAIAASVSFGYDESGALQQIFIMRNPDKLAGLPVR